MAHAIRRIYQYIFPKNIRVSESQMEMNGMMCRVMALTNGLFMAICEFWMASEGLTPKQEMLMFLIVLFGFATMMYCHWYNKEWSDIFVTKKTEKQE